MGPREPDLELAVEHFFNFWRFCSTLEPVRDGFGVGGRTFFQILEILFYFGARVSRIWVREQTKFVRKALFLSALVSVGFGVGGRTFFQILEILFYFGARVSRIWVREQTKFVRKALFLSALVSVRPSPFARNRRPASTGKSPK